MEPMDSKMKDIFSTIDAILKKSGPVNENPTLRQANTGEQAVIHFNNDTKQYYATSLDSSLLNCIDPTIQRLRLDLLEKKYAVLYAESAFLQATVEFAMDMAPVMALLSLFKDL